METPASNLRGDSFQQFYTPPKGPATPASPVKEMETSNHTPVSSAAVAASITRLDPRLITPLSFTPPAGAPKFCLGTSSTVNSVPTFSVEGPLSSFGESLSKCNSSISGTSK